MKRKSSIGLITGIVIVLLLIPVWYTMLAPSIIISELENIDLTLGFEGTFGKIGYVGTYSIIDRVNVWEIPVTITAHVYAAAVEEENVVLRVDVTMVRGDDGTALPAPFSRNSTYVFSKSTLENVKDSPDADKPREGHDPLYPSHLGAGEDIPNAWLDNLNITATLEYQSSTEEEGLTLYEYVANETITKTLWIEDLGVGRNCTLISTKTLLLEPLSGLLAYTKEETLDWVINREGEEPLPLVYLRYKSTGQGKTDGIATARTAHDGLQLLELYIPAILGVVAIILVLGLAFNIRRLKRKKLA